MRAHEKQSEADTSKNAERYDLTLNCKEECDKPCPKVSLRINGQQ